MIVIADEEMARRPSTLERVRVRQHPPGGATPRPDLDTGYSPVQCVSSRQNLCLYKV